MLNWNIFVILSFKSGLQMVASIPIQTDHRKSEGLQWITAKSRYAKVKMNIQLSYVHVQSLTMQSEPFFFLRAMSHNFHNL